MNITFMIGNGFDINAGFKTSYRDFIKYYVNSESASNQIREFKEIINEDRDTWADAEIALGEITERYKTTSSFLICYIDFCSSLAKYMIEQEANADYTKNNYKSPMLHSLLNFSKHLTVMQRERFDKYLSATGGEMHFNFINFNYTRIFDNCVKSLPISERRRFECQIDARYYRGTIGDILHIHGDLSSPILLGVNDETQIANENFHKERKFIRQLIKPVTNIGLQTGRDSESKRIIKSSDVICLFGMSLGATDKLWWQQIGLWLKQNANNCLIVFTLADSYNINLAASFLDTEEDVQERLFTYSNLSESERTSLRNQIFVAINKPLFRFKLAKEASEMLA